MRKALGGLGLVALASAIAIVLVRSLERPAPAPVSRAGDAPAQTAPREPQRRAEPALEPAPTRAELHARLLAAIEAHLPDRKLSSEELDAAADALLRLRAARLELAALPRTPENAERLRELREAIGQAAADFEYVMDLDPAAFTERVSPEGGIDRDREDASE